MEADFVPSLRSHAAARDGGRRRTRRHPAARGEGRARGRAEALRRRSARGGRNALGPVRIGRSRDRGRRPSRAGSADGDDADEQHLAFVGFLVFVDRPKADAAVSLARLDRLGIVVKVITGDSPQVAVKVAHDLDLKVLGVLTGEQVDALADDELGEAIERTTIFARVGPETKARIVRVQRLRGADVAFMGDGVNDAVALHHADVGISVDTGTDVAKDAADIILLDKDLGVLADGVVEGRRIFANTIKYVLMATSSNFGNMFSAAAASAFLSFLPMLPTQILLNNLLVRRQPDDDPDRRRRRGDAGPTVGVGHRLHPQLHDVLRAAELDLRLRDLRRDALGDCTRTRRSSAPDGSSNRSRRRRS